MYKSVELRQERAGIWEKAKALLLKAEDEGRDFTAEEQVQWDAMDADIDNLAQRIERLEAADRRDAAMVQTPDRQFPDSDDAPDAEGERAKEYKRVFDLYVRGGREDLNPDERKTLRSQYQTLEKRALSSITGASGAFTIPEGDMPAMVAAMLDWGGLGTARTTKLRTTDGREIPIPTANDTGSIGRLISENVQVATDQDPAFGLKILRAYQYTSDMVQVPFAMLEDPAVDIDKFLREAFAMRLGRITNQHDTTATGDSQPEGFVPAATVGVTTAANDAITYNELVDAEHAVYEAYRKRGEWMFNDATLKYFKKKVDGASRPMWVPGIAYGAPDQILNHPYRINSDMADIAASAKVLAFGDFSSVWQRDVKAMQILRLVERYADYAQVGFVAFLRHDAKYVNAGTDPIKVLQMHA